MPRQIVLERLNLIKSKIRTTKKVESPLIPFRFPVSDVLLRPHFPSTCPDVAPFYDKDIFAFIPHLQIPDHDLTCTNGDCRGHLNPDGFPSDGNFYRRVYGIDCSSYLINYYYKCVLCGRKKSSAVMLEESQVNIENPCIPLHIQNQIGIYVMPSSAITYTLRDYVLNSSLTSSSFYQIRENIHSSYLARFMLLH